MEKQEYELHNLAHIYIKYRAIKNAKPLSTKDYLILKKVFTAIDQKPFDIEDFMNFGNGKAILTNQSNNNAAIKVLLKILSENIVPYSQLMMNEINWYVLKDNKDLFQITKLKIKITDKSKNKSASLFLYGDKDFHLNKVLILIYHPLSVFIIFILITIYGVLRKRMFYVFWGLIWILLDLIVFITMPFFRSLYFYPQFLNACVIGFVPIIETLQNKQIEKTKHWK